MILLCVRYHTKPGLRGEFVKALADERIAEQTHTEPGNLAYEFSVPIGEEDTVCLLERWESAEALIPHPQQLPPSFFCAEDWPFPSPRGTLYPYQRPCRTDDGRRLAG